MNKQTKSFFCKLLKKKQFPLSNIIDVGVQHQTAALRENFKHVHQVLIEPQKHLIPKIKKIYKDNKYTLYNMGVSDTKTKLFVHLSDKDLCRLDSDTTSDTEVEVDTLNNICRDLEKWLLLKIDVDGPECKVLDGANEILEKCAFVIIEAQCKKFNEIYTKLCNSNFSLFSIVDPLYLEDLLWQVDLIFINKDVQKNYTEFDVGNLFRNENNRNFNK